MPHLNLALNTDTEIKENLTAGETSNVSIGSAQVNRHSKEDEPSSLTFRIKHEYQ